MKGWKVEDIVRFRSKNNATPKNHPPANGILIKSKTF